MTGCGFSSGLYKDIIKAQDLINEQQFKKAAKIYESILIKKPSKNIEIKINYQLGDLYSIYLNDYKKSLHYYESIVENSNEPNWQVKSLERMAFINFENLKDFESAEKQFNTLLRFQPVLKDQNRYKLMYAKSIFEQKNYQRAIKEFKSLDDKLEQELILDKYYFLGLAHFYRKEWNSALENWKEYLRRESNLDKIVNTKFLIANAYESSERLKEAYNIYYSILGDYPHPEIINQRLEALYNRRIARKR